MYGADYMDRDENTAKYGCPREAVDICELV